MSTTIASPQDLENKINSYDAVVLFSGGTDSTISALLTKEKTKGKILLLTVDFGIGKEEREKATDRARLLGMDHIIYDGIDEFCQVYISQAIHMNSDYQQFPLGTPLARSMAFHLAIRYLEGNKNNTDKFLVIGSTKRQNSRLRAERTLSRFNGIKCYAPLAEKNLSRPAKVELLKKYNIPIKYSDSFSTDENLWSNCMESHELNKLDLHYDEKWFSLTKSLEEASEIPETLELSFQCGIPTCINGKHMNLSRLIQSLNEIGKEHGIGRIHNVEDTAFADKIRSLYEAPGATIILKSHKFIEKLVLNKQERDIKESYDKRWGDLIYNGEWESEERKSIYSACIPFQHRVNGILKIQLYKGNISIIGGEIPDSLLLKQEIPGLY